MKQIYFKYIKYRKSVLWAMVATILYWVLHHHWAEVPWLHWMLTEQDNWGRCAGGLCDVGGLQVQAWASVCNEDGCGMLKMTLGSQTTMGVDQVLVRMIERFNVGVVVDIEQLWCGIVMGDEGVVSRCCRGVSRHGRCRCVVQWSNVAARGATTWWVSVDMGRRWHMAW